MHSHTRLSWTALLLLASLAIAAPVQKLQPKSGQSKRPAPGPASLGPMSQAVGPLPQGPRQYIDRSSYFQHIVPAGLQPPTGPQRPGELRGTPIQAQPLAPGPPLSPIGSIVIGKGSYDIIREVRISSKVSSTYALSDQTFLAKSFKTQQSPEIKTAYDLESERTSKILRLYPQIVNSGPTTQLTGKSKIRGRESDGEYDWLLAPSLNGRGLLSQGGWKQAHASGHKDCVALIQDFIRRQFARHMLEFRQRTGLVHTEPDTTRIMWSPDAKKIIGLIGYDKLDVVDGPLYKAAFVRHGLSSGSSWAQVIDKMSMDYFPDSLCPDETGGGKRQRTGPPRR